MFGCKSISNSNRRIHTSNIDINNLVFIRGGIGNIQRIINDVNASQRDLEFQPNLGLGLRLGRLYVDYALTNIGSVSGVLVSNIELKNVELIIPDPDSQYSTVILFVSLPIPLGLGILLTFHLSDHGQYDLGRILSPIKFLFMLL